MSKKRSLFDKWKWVAMEIDMLIEEHGKNRDTVRGKRKKSRQSESEILQKIKFSNGQKAQFGTHAEPKLGGWIKWRVILKKWDIETGRH